MLKTLKMLNPLKKRQTRRRVYNSKKSNSNSKRDISKIKQKISILKEKIKSPTVEPRIVLSTLKKIKYLENFLNKK